MHRPGTELAISRSLVRRPATVLVELLSEYSSRKLLRWRSPSCNDLCPSPNTSCALTAVTLLDEHQESHLAWHSTTQCRPPRTIMTPWKISSSVLQCMGNHNHRQGSTPPPGKWVYGQKWLESDGIKIVGRR